MLKYKIIIAGAKNVGKTSFIARFCDNVFNLETLATIGVDFKRKSITVTGSHKDISLELNIWDFAGEEKYRTLFPAYANGASAAFLLFDTTNKESLELAKKTGRKTLHALQRHTNRKGFRKHRT